VLERARRTHWDARHHCVGWVLGPDRANEHAGDEGEPLGTGGAPILGELRSRELSDVVAVVSRWSGDSWLGPDVLSRAYGEVTRTALDDVGVLERVLQDLCEVEVDIAEVGRLEHDLRSRGARVLGVEYTGEALLRFAVPPRARAVVDEIVAELTGGRAAPRVIGQEWVDSAA